MLKRKNKDKLKLNKTKSWRKKLPMPKKRDKTKKFSPRKELRNSRNSKRKRLLKSLRPRKWNKNFYLLRLSKKPKLLLLRRLLLRQTLQD